MCSSDLIDMFRYLRVNVLVPVTVRLSGPKNSGNRTTSYGLRLRVQRAAIGYACRATRLGVAPRFLRELQSIASSARRQERMVEDLVGHASALGNPFALVEAPVDPEIDSALAIFFLGLRQ